MGIDIVCVVVCFEICVLCIEAGCSLPGEVSGFLVRERRKS